MNREEKLRYRGEWSKDACSKCKGRMLENKAGEKWCSQCSFGLLDFKNQNTSVQVNERILP